LTAEARTQSSASYYQPNKADRGKVDPSVPAGGSLTIGYGDGGHPPRYYEVSDKQDIDIGCLKLFVATEPVDFSHIAQPSPFFSNRGDAPPPSRPLSLWDSIVVYTVQHGLKLTLFSTPVRITALPLLISWYSLSSALLLFTRYPFTPVE